MDCRIATTNDWQLLTACHHQLIQDEADRHPMKIPQLKDRMRGWITTGGYSAIIFGDDGEAVDYARYREEATEIYLRQLFVMRRLRRQGIARRAVATLKSIEFASGVQTPLATKGDACPFGNPIILCPPQEAGFT